MVSQTFSHTYFAIEILRNYPVKKEKQTKQAVPEKLQSRCLVVAYNIQIYFPQKKKLVLLDRFVFI